MPAFLTRPQGGVLSAATFGARGDGVTNSSPGLQAAVDAAQTDITSIRKVVIPAGTYVLNTSVAKAGSVHIEGEGQEQTVIQPPTGAPAFTLGSMTQSQPHGMRLADMTFRINGAIASGYPVIDVQQYGRKWSMERLNFDLGFSNRPALRLWTSWTGSVRDCNFWKIGGEGLAGQRAAVIVRPQTIAATALGPINNLLFDGCVWERVQLGIDLHDGSDLTGTSTIYSVEIRNPRFKNSSTTGPTPNSIGIRSNSNSTFGVVVTSAFFEDFDIGAVVKGHGWTFTNPFFQSATTCIDLATGSAHLIDGMVLQGSANNTIGTGVLGEAGLSGMCEVRRWKNVGTVPPTNATLDNSGAARLNVTAA